MSKKIETFKQEAKEVRDDFVNTIGKYYVSEHLDLRTKSDTLLIMYDQAVDKYKENSPVSDEEIEKKLSNLLNKTYFEGMNNVTSREFDKFVKEEVSVFSKWIQSKQGDGWVSVEDRLPEGLTKTYLSDVVLVTDGETYDIAVYDDEYKCWQGFLEPTHWKPITPPTNK